MKDILQIETLIGLEVLQIFNPNLNSKRQLINDGLRKGPINSKMIPYRYGEYLIISKVSYYNESKLYSIKVLDLGNNEVIEEYTIDHLYEYEPILTLKSL